MRIMRIKRRFMRKFVALALAVSTWMGGIGGVILVSMMLITVFDVMLRCIGRPMSGTYDLVALGGALIIGFSVPYTTMKKGHIIVDVLTQGLSERGQKRAQYLYTPDLPGRLLHDRLAPDKTGG